MTARDAQREALPPMTEIDKQDDDALRFAQRVLESNAPESDRKAARDMLVAIRTRVRKAYLAAGDRTAASPASRGEAAGAGHRAPTQPEAPLSIFAKEPTAEEFVRMLLWDEFPECCGSPVVGAEYMGQQEMLCCGCPEPALLSDARIVEQLRAKFPDAAPQPLQSQGREVPTGRDRTSEAGRSPPSYGARSDHPATADLLRQAAEARGQLVEVLESLRLANETPGGPITDTLWMQHQPQTVFDAIADVIELLAPQPDGAP